MTARAGVILDPGPFSNHLSTVRAIGGDEQDISHDVDGIENLLEYQQARKQVQFAEKFHQLKQWQEEQKEQLLQQQQQRMDLLRCQQEQLQRALAEQRNKQWGGSTSFSSPSKGQSPSVRHHAGSPLSRESSSPPERGQASLLQRYDSNSLGNLLQQAQSDILQEEEVGSDIENAGSVEEDGFYPLPDTASELSDGDGLRFEMDGDNSPLVENFHSHHIPKLQEQSPSQDQRQSEQLPCNPSASSPPYRQGASSLRDGEAAGDLTGHESKEADQSGERPKSKASSDDGDDDRPIESQFGYSTKSFEELLEEKLQLENASNQMQQQKGRKKPVHAFLKKGEGLARFGKMKMPSTRMKKKQKELLEGQRSSTDSFVDREQREIQDVNRQQSNRDDRLSDPGDTNNVFRKPVGRAPVSILKERLPSRSSAASHDSVRSTPSKEGLEAEDSQADKSFGLVQWEKKKVIEEEDLAEFEMLEQAAEDNVSFSSENSLVIGVMQRARLRGKMFNSSPLNKKGLPTLHSVDAADDGTDESHGKSGDQKMPLEESPEEEEEEEYSSDMNDTLTEESGIERRQMATRKVIKGRSVNSNFGSKLEKRLQNRTEFEEILQQEDGEAKSEDEQHSLEESSESDDDGDNSIDGLVTVIPNRLQNMLGHGRGSQDGEVEERPVVSREEIIRKNQRTERESRGDQQMGTFVNIEEMNRNNDRPSEASGSRSEESDREGGDGDERGREQSGGAGYEFEDDETWGDFSANLSDSSSDSIVLGGPSLTSTPPTKLNVKSKSVLERESVERESADEHKDPIGSTPPPSHLVAKLFPQLKRKEKVTPDQNAATSTLHAVRDRPIGEGLQAKVFKDKLAELENEIERFRKENAALSRLRDERERGLKLFKKEVTEFERQKEAELKKIEEYRDKEMKKLRKEKKLFEKHQKAARSLPDKKDREEIDQLKNQLSELQQELSRRESRWSVNTRRLKDRVEALIDENKNLTEEVETMRAKRQEDLAKGERKKAAARIRALREAGKPKSLIPEFEPGKFPALPSNVGTISEKSKTSNIQQKRTTTHKDSLKQSSKRKDDADSSDSDISEINSPSSSPSPLRGNDHHPAPSPPSVRDQEAFKSPQISPERDGGDTKEQQVHHPDGKVEVLHPDGSKVITFSNGTKKEISSDGQLITVTFFNGDTRQIFPDQRVVYYYAETQITHTTYSDGLEIIHFPNNQTEKHYPDGTKEITFPDQTIKYLFQNGGEECVFPDGTLLRVAPDGERTMEFPNGQREIHTAEYKKREYPDGTVKTIYPDGRQETRYSHGRIRVKDKDGRVLLDHQT